MAMEGMDPDVVEGIGKKLTAQGDAIQQVISKIDSLVNQAEQAWKGQDANKFKSDWDGQFKSALTSAKTEIDQLGTTAVQNAAQQRQTSSN